MVDVRQFARGNAGVLAGADTELDTTNPENDSDIKKEADQSKSHRMAKVHDILETWQGSQNLRVT